MVGEWGVDGERWAARGNSNVCMQGVLLLVDSDEIAVHRLLQYVCL